MMALVIVCVDLKNEVSSSGTLPGNRAVWPAATTTIIVSPMARESARTNEEAIPDAAEGMTTPVETSNFVAPRP
jgi:hypothetical protein